MSLLEGSVTHPLLGDRRSIEKNVDYADIYYEDTREAARGRFHFIWEGTCVCHNFLGWTWVHLHW